MAILAKQRSESGVNLVAVTKRAPERKALPKYPHLLDYLLCHFFRTLENFLLPVVVKTKLGNIVEIFVKNKKNIFSLMKKALLNLC